MIRIREINIGDEELLEELEELDTLAFAGTASKFKIETGYWWVAFAEGKIVGYAGYEPATLHRGMIYLIRAGVSQDFRGHGLQKRFIRVREKHARKKGFIGAVTDTANNPFSSNNLISCGYRLYEPKYRWGLVESLYWRKIF